MVSHMGFDMTVTGGLVVDGSGADPVAADVGIRDGRITAVGDLSTTSSSRTLNASGLWCTPGFIDTHTHSDLAAFLDPAHDAVRLASVRQGVTTEVCGNCGFSPFPVPEEAAGAVAAHLGTLWSGRAHTFPDLVEYAAAVEGAGLVNNLVPLVGHGTLRAAVVGFDARDATAAELDAMAALLDTALAEGAAGLSTGLVYPPAHHAPTAEIIHLARVAARHHRLYATHIRDETDRVPESVAEALRVADQAGVPVHISHLKSAGPPNWGVVQEVVATLDQAQGRGVDVTADMYPYTAGSTMLHSLLPPWVSAGGVAAMLERLADPKVRKRIGGDIASGLPGFQNLAGLTGWGNVSVASAPRHPEYEGRSIADLAAAAAADPVDLVAELLIAEEAAVTIIHDSMSLEDNRATLAWSHTMVGSDGIPTPGKPHPRWAGSFVRMLGRYGREERLVGMADAVRKMTSLPAARFGLAGRGALRERAAADVVVLDPATVTDRATYTEPLLPPAGIHHVVVGGVAVILDGEPTGATPGRVLRTE